MIYGILKTIHTGNPLGTFLRTARVTVTRRVSVQHFTNLKLHVLPHRWTRERQ